MNCAQCSKVVPDGFTECPWCGARPSAVAALTSNPPTSSLETFSSTHHFLIIVSLVCSTLLFGLLNYFAAERSVAALTLDNFPYFLGRCAGALIVGALAVFLLGKIRGTRLRGPVHALVIVSLSSLVTLATFAFLPRTPASDQARPGHARRSPAAQNQSVPPSIPASKWDPATRSLLKDVQARNEQYVRAVSTLDESAKPLYTPDSFRDASTIQAVIDQLHARVSVADEYADWAPVFSHMKEYVATIDASDAEKQQFLANYEASLPGTLAACKTISNKEHAWLRATLDLYQFALSRDGQYSWRQDQLSFRNRADSQVFQQKFAKAQSLNGEFLQAYLQMRRLENNMMARMGFEPSESDSAH